jgi:hypothetical protein
VNPSVLLELQPRYVEINPGVVHPNPTLLKFRSTREQCGDKLSFCFRPQSLRTGQVLYQPSANGANGATEHGQTVAHARLRFQRGLSPSGYFFDDFRGMTFQIDCKHHDSAPSPKEVQGVFAD